MDALAGVSETLTGTVGGDRVTAALPDLVGSAMLVAITVTVWALLIDDGAV